ncbi:TetR/AcrR family transcriptional regulator [Herpetosiphon llansteffanensis]|uniref:TetR/AcrR family transcriptional regulator n=1 Tax=Herpetosiphon llansteffanensis TaxID=2094568 RepID=UPI000D7BEC27|nr:TetR/AcrR family transcriptional regulator [Herpetosiphon llansteffanensis]
MNQPNEKLSGRQSESTAQQTRQRILLSARHLFALQGFEALSLRDIASHADVTHGLLRHHFGSKEAIWQAVVDAALADYLAALLPLVDAAIAEQHEPSAVIKRSVATIIRLSASFCEVPRLMVHESISGGERLNYFMQQLRPLSAMMQPFFEAMRAEGKFQQFSHPTFLLAVISLGILPLALASFSNALAQIDILEQAELERHIERVIATLMPWSTS